jgi:hypothetical protein
VAFPVFRHVWWMGRKKSSPFHSGSTKNGSREPIDFASFKCVRFATSHLHFLPAASAGPPACLISMQTASSGVRAELAIPCSVYATTHSKSAALGIDLRGLHSPHLAPSSPKFANFWPVCDTLTGFWAATVRALRAISSRSLCATWKENRKGFFHFGFFAPRPRLRRHHDHTLVTFVSGRRLSGPPPARKVQWPKCRAGGAQPDEARRKVAHAQLSAHISHFICKTRRTIEPMCDQYQLISGEACLASCCSGHFLLLALH